MIRGYHLKTLNFHYGITLAKLLIPHKTNLWNSILIWVMVLTGAVILTPLVEKAPFLGWDWFYFFNGNNPNFNILSSTSAYPPYTAFFIQLLTWLNWRKSLALLNAITLTTVAISTWKNGGRYFSICLALITPSLWMLMWIGHVEGLVLLGLVTGFIPLALIKPQLAIWAVGRNKQQILWTLLFLGLTLVIWPWWPIRLGSATLTHEAAFGWVVTGWPVLILGIILLIGAGNDMYRLVAAGLLISPYLMPYNLVILLPVLGQVRGYRKILIWGSTWLLLLGVGLGGWAKYLSLVFPITAYCFTHSWDGYKENVIALLELGKTSGMRLLNPFFRK